MIKIKAAAIYVDGEIYTLPKPNRHADIFAHFKDKNIMNGEQGFITECCNFVDRQEALKIAIRANQTIKRHDENRLFTEDLW